MRVSTLYLIPFLCAEKVSRHVFRQHVGDQGFVPASHLVNLLLLLMDLNLPQEQSASELFYLHNTTKTRVGIKPHVQSWDSPVAVVTPDRTYLERLLSNISNPSGLTLSDPGQYKTFFFYCKELSFASFILRLKQKSFRSIWKGSLFSNQDFFTQICSLCLSLTHLVQRALGTISATFDLLGSINCPFFLLLMGS